MSAGDTVITAACAECGDGWQRTGRGEDEVSRVLGECRDHGEAAGHRVTWTVEFGGAQGGAFWDDLRQNMADPEFAAEYGRASAEIAATDKAVHPEHSKQSGPDSAPAADAVPWPPEVPHLDPAGIIACLTLNLEPVPKGRPRVSPAEYERVKGARVKVKKAHAWTPARTARYEEHVGWLLRQAHVRRADSGPVAVHAAFHVRDPGSQLDADNLLKALLDSCNGIAWEDDSQVTRLRVDLVRDSPRPRTELLIYALPAGGEPG